MIWNEGKEKGLSVGKKSPNYTCKKTNVRKNRLHITIKRSYVKNECIITQHLEIKEKKKSVE